MEKSFAKVNESAGQVASLVEQITQASKDQAKGVDQINTAISQMDKVVQQNAAGAEESASASEELSSQAQVLRQTVNQMATLINGHTTQLTGATITNARHESAVAGKDRKAPDVHKDSIAEKTKSTVSKF